MPHLPPVSGGGIPGCGRELRQTRKGEASNGRDGIPRARLGKGAALHACRGEQGKLWQFQDALYANQGDENSGWVTDALLERIAKRLGLDWAKLKKDADGAVTLQQANSMADEANQRQIQGTPTFYVQVGDQQPYQVNPSSFEPSELASILDDALSS